MSRLKKLFKTKDRRILNVYCTAGYPYYNATLPVMKALQEHGANVIELGMPYSDPLADGPVIQQSSRAAIANGMTITRLFEQLKDFRNEIDIPVLLMGYLNPVLQYGFEQFCADAAAVGIDGLIIPDLPEHEFEREYGTIIKKHGLDFIFLITPDTDAERVCKLDNLSSGFLYAVSGSTITGNAEVGAGQEATLAQYMGRLKNLNLRNPVLVGFGIRDREGFDTVCRFAEGGIIGSAYIKALENNPDVNASTKSFLSSILG